MWARVVCQFYADEKVSTCRLVGRDFVNSFCADYLSAGCSGEGGWQRRILQSVEGIYPVLCPSRATHCADIHLPGADECSVLQIRSQG